jgi:hypothetical protein
VVLEQTLVFEVVRSKLPVWMPDHVAGPTHSRQCRTTARHCRSSHSLYTRGSETSCSLARRLSHIDRHAGDLALCRHMY